MRDRFVSILKIMPNTSTQIDRKKMYRAETWYFCLNMEWNKNKQWQQQQKTPNEVTFYPT